MENNFFTWSDFIDGFSKEMAISEEVYTGMVGSGLIDNSLIKFDFTFISNKKVNLEKLSEYLKKNYKYSIEKIEFNDENWELNGETYLMPITEDNLLYWALDMYKRGYEFDSQLEGYGGLVDSKEQKFPQMENIKADVYFDKGLDCYNENNLSGAIHNWNLAIKIDPKDPNSYYYIAIVKNELYTWKAALKDYDKALEIAPNFASALINRGGVKDENDNYQGAIDDYNKVLQIENLDLENKQQAYFNLGNTYLNLDNKKLACENWNKALELGAEYAKERISKHCEK